MSDKLDDEILNKIAKAFQNCEEKCKYHKQFSELKNKDEVFKALQIVLKALVYHEKENDRLPPGVRAAILILLNIFSTQYSLFEILNWYIDTLIEIDNQKKWIN